MNMFVYLFVCVNLDRGMWGAWEKRGEWEERGWEAGGGRSVGSSSACVVVLCVSVCLCLYLFVCAHIYNGGREGRAAASNQPTNQRTKPDDPKTQLHNMTIHRARQGGATGAGGGAAGAGVGKDRGAQRGRPDGRACDVFLNIYISRSPSV